MGWQPPVVVTPNPNKTKPFWNRAFLKRINFHIILIDNHHRRSGPNMQCSCCLPSTGDEDFVFHSDAWCRNIVLVVVVAPKNIEMHGTNHRRCPVLTNHHSSIKSKTWYPWRGSLKSRNFIQPSGDSVREKIYLRKNNPGLTAVVQWRAFKERSDKTSKASQINWKC